MTPTEDHGGVEATAREIALAIVEDVFSVPPEHVEQAPKHCGPGCTAPCEYVRLVDAIATALVAAPASALTPPDPVAGVLVGVAGFWTADDIVRLALVLSNAKLTLGQLLDEMRDGRIARLS